MQTLEKVRGLLTERRELLAKAESDLAKANAELERCKAEYSAEAKRRSDAVAELQKIAEFVDQARGGE